MPKNTSICLEIKLFCANHHALLQKSTEKGAYLSVYCVYFSGLMWQKRETNLSISPHWLYKLYFSETISIIYNSYAVRHRSYNRSCFNTPLDSVFKVFHFKIHIWCLFRLFLLIKSHLLLFHVKHSAFKYKHHSPINHL